MQVTIHLDRCGTYSNRSTRTLEIYDLTSGRSIESLSAGNANSSFGIGNVDLTIGHIYRVEHSYRDWRGDLYNPGYGKLYLARRADKYNQTTGKATYGYPGSSATYSLGSTSSDPIGVYLLGDYDILYARADDSDTRSGSNHIYSYFKFMGKVETSTVKTAASFRIRSQTPTFGTFVSGAPVLYSGDEGETFTSTTYKGGLLNYLIKPDMDQTPDYIYCLLKAYGDEIRRKFSVTINGSATTDYQGQYFSFVRHNGVRYEVKQNTTQGGE